MQKTPIYMDHAATRALRPAALEEMLPYLTGQYGNASAVYSLGSAAKIALEEARAALAETIGAQANEIYFTSGGTESDNWALVAAAEAMRERGRHIVTTAVEHHAVLHTCAYLERRGFEVTVLPVDGEGRVSPERLREALRPDTVLVSAMAANNEVGTVQPLRELAQLTKEHGALFHTDAVQAYGRLPLSVRALPIDLLSASAHKLGGPKGVGFLYIRSGVPVGAFHHGGMQERGRRAGTENVAGAVGFVAAARETFARRAEETAREAALQRFFWEKLRERLPETVLHGPAVTGEDTAEPWPSRLPNNLNFSIPGVSAESALILLDMDGICASGGSACTTGAVAPSHVLTAMGVSPAQAREALRFTLGAENTEAEIEETVAALAAIAERIRKLGGH